MFKNIFNKINPMVIHADDLKVVEIIERVINHPNTFIYKGNAGVELVFTNEVQKMNILIKENQKLIEVNSSNNCITYSVKFVAMNKIIDIINKHNKSEFLKVINKIKLNKDCLTNKIISDLKES